MIKVKLTWSNFYWIKTNYGKTNYGKTIIGTTIIGPIKVSNGPLIYIYISLEIVRKNRWCMLLVISSYLQEAYIAPTTIQKSVEVFLPGNQNGDFSAETDF